MKQVIYALVLPLVVVSGLVFANRDSKAESFTKLPPTPLSAAGAKTAKEQWETTSDGIFYKLWEISFLGGRVYAAEAKIRKHLIDFADMQAVVISLTLPPGSRLGFGVMVRMNGDDYILSFGPLKSDEFQQLQSLKVADKIIIRSRNVSHAPKYAYPIVSGDYVEREGKLIYKRVPGKGGC